MNETRKIIRQVNMLMEAGGGKPLEIEETPGTTELELLRAAKESYRRRLCEMRPAYKSLPPEFPIPDMFFLALRNREREISEQTRE